MTLSEIEKALREGMPSVECPWEIFRVVNFPGKDHEEAAELLGQWAVGKEIEVEFDKRGALAGKRKVDVIYVLFTAR